MGTAENTLRNTIELLASAQVVAQHGDRVWLHPDLGVVVGVDLTGATASVAIARLDFELISNLDDPGARRQIPIEDPERSLDEIARLVAEQLDAYVGQERTRERLIGIALTVPGPVLRERNRTPSGRSAAAWDRRVQAGPILPGWDNINAGARLATLLKDAHGLRPPRHEQRRFVWLENDASAGALGVHTELRIGLAEKAPDDLIYVRMTSGIGAGIMNKGHLLTGARGFAGELGHVSIDAGGPLCPACGGRGCLETFASNRTVMRQLDVVFEGSPADIPDRRIESTAVSEAARLEYMLQQSHPAVDRALRDAGWHVGALLGQICCMLNPSWIVFSGVMPEHRSSIPPSAQELPTDNRPFLTGVTDALDLHATPQATAGLETKTWEEVRSEDQPLSPEMLGALALVVDHLGDAYLLTPIEQWIREPHSRSNPLSFQ